MKKISLKTVLLCGVIALCLNACKKDNPESTESTTTGNNNVSKSNLLTGGSVKAWRRTVFETQDGIYTPDSCTLDDRLNLSHDGTLTRTFGPHLCNPGQSTVNGTWALSSNETVITFTGTLNGNTVTQTMSLLELTQQKMKVFYISSGDSITETYENP